MVGQTIWRRSMVAALGAGLALAAGIVQGDAPADELAARQQRLRENLAELQSRADEVKKEIAATGRERQELAKAGAVDLDALQFALPRLKSSPTIDGIIGEDEWAGAIGVPLPAGLHGGLLERPSSIFYLGWDDEHLYLAQRLPLREGERLVRLNRERKHDHVAPHETSLEAYVDRKGHGSHGSGCRWQFMGNAVGNRWEREDQYEIGQNFVGWDGPWQYAQRLTPDGKFWESEIAIPRKAVYQDEPLKDGDLWWLGFATNLHRPWTWSGFYGWRIPGTFREATPEIRMRDIARSHAVRGIAFDMDIRNTTADAFAGEVVTRLTGGRDRKTVLFEKSRPVALAPGEVVNLTVDDRIGEDIVADGAMSRLAVIVKQGEKSLYTWSFDVRYNHPDNREGLAYTPDEAAFPLTAAYNPLSDYLRVAVDIYDFAAADAVAKARFAVRPAGGGTALGEDEITLFDLGKGEGRISTPSDLAPGEYECVVALLDANGKTLAEEKTSFVRKDHRQEFPWLFDNTLGEQDEVLPPFTPLAATGGAIQAFRKEITLDGSALPARIMAAGVELLRSPIALNGEANGQSFTVSPAATAPELVAGSATRAQYRGTATGGPLAVDITAEWEYDSTCRIALTLRPQDGKAARLDALRLVIPMTAAGGVNYMSNGLNMRLSNQAGRIPGADRVGTVWDSTSIPYQKMTVGSFVPIVWLGNLRSGITWFADGDRGWWPSDDRPAIEIVRDADGCASLILNLAAGPVELNEPRQIVFGINVNPVRPYSDHYGSTHTFGFLEETGRWVRERQPRNFARRYPDNPELNRKVAERSQRVGKIYAPYTEMSWADFAPDVVEYFREEWDRGGLGGPFFSKSSNDYLTWLFDRWIQDCGVDGLYFDNVFNRVNYNLHVGTAYRLPDGRIQPGYNLWGMRDNIKRTRGVLAARKGDAPFRICIHNTRFQFAPIMGFADLAMGGEMPTPSGTNPGAGDWMDMHPRDFMDVMYNVPLWGYKLNHLYHFRPDSYTDAFGEPDDVTAMKVHRGAMAAMLINGVEFFQGIRYQNFLASKFRMVKQAAGGLEFMPGWDADGKFRLENDDPELGIAVWRGQDALLLIVANYGKREKMADAWLDFPQLIRPPIKSMRRQVCDFETLEGFAPWRHRGDGTMVNREFPDDVLPRLDEGADTTINIPNTIRLRVAPRDFRVVLFANQPVGGSGSGF